jgi:membrane-associated phospholipid phosphatase
MSQPGAWLSTLVLNWPNWVKVCCLVFFPLFFLIIYGLASVAWIFLPWHLSLDLSFESAIPCHPAWAWVYLSMTILLVLPILFISQPTVLIEYFGVLIFQLFVGAFFFLVLPLTSLSLEGCTHISSSVHDAAFELAGNINLVGNYFPSLHVAFAWTTSYVIAQNSKKWLHITTMLWALSISLSTLFTRQHYLIDVVAGWVLAYVTVNKLPKNHYFIRWANNIELEWLCLRNFLLFSLRHRRYALIAFGLYLESSVAWSSKRILRSGFAFLQEIDDLLDGDRYCEQEPLIYVGQVRQAILSGQFGVTPLMRLTELFMREASYIDNAVEFKEILLELLDVMSTDRQRVLRREIWPATRLQDQLRKTFRLSLNLTLIARKSPLRAENHAELVDMLAWCSVMRDLHEDLQAGLINIPLELVSSLNRPVPILASALSEPEILKWIDESHQAVAHLFSANRSKIRAINKIRGAWFLRLFSNSVEKFWRKRFHEIYSSQ